MVHGSLTGKRKRPAFSPRRGAALLLAVLAVALVGLASISRLHAGTQVTRREAEDELLRVGVDWQRALLSYVRDTPGQESLGPTTLGDLLRDPRFPGLRRHLRTIPVDPMTGSLEWGLVKSADGRIVGVHSLSAEPIIRRSGFPPGWEAFAEAQTYRDWVFHTKLPLEDPAPRVIADAHPVPR